METSAAIQLYEISVEKHSLFYDSSANKELCKINVNSQTQPIEKEKGIEHVINKNELTSKKQCS